MSNVEKMFTHLGKTTKVIGKNRTKTYNEMYDYVSKLQDSGDLKTHGNYLNSNQLAESIYEKIKPLVNIKN